VKGAIAIAVATVAGCTGDDGDPIVIDLATVLDADRNAEVTRRFSVDGARDVSIVVGPGAVVEAWIDGGSLDGAPWLRPRPESGTIDLVATGDGDVTVTAWARGDTPPPAMRDRALAWFDGELLDDPSIVSFAGVMAAISDDGHGGRLLDRWFRGFAAGPGAGRATFQQFLGEVADAQGADPSAWNLAALPFRVTGVHNRHDLGRGDGCGELRVSIASTHPTFAPLHLIFLFRVPPADDDVTPDGAIHCLGAARRWARLADIDAAAWPAAARAIVAEHVTRDRFVLAESVELTISPWQWRQWLPDDNSFVNPPLFQTVDIARANTPGPARDALLAAVAADAAAIAARTWPVPETFRAPVAEVQPNLKADLVDLSPLPDVLAAYPDLPRELGMIGCPRCHTDDADFVQTGADRRPSPFYDRELDARAARLDALNRGDAVAPAPFGPLQ
jgi:hypothetical protein